MQRLKNCDITLDIELITLISGGNQKFEILFLAKDKETYKLIFDFVWDMRYSIENASIDRFCEFRKCLPEGLIDNSIFKVENSEYVQYFEQQTSGTRPIDALEHYIISDGIDTTIDILAVEAPSLVGC